MKNSLASSLLEQWWVVAIHITHLTRQERGTVEGSIKLVDLSRILALHIYRMKAVTPCIDGSFPHLIKLLAKLSTSFSKLEIAFSLPVNELAVLNSIDFWPDL